MTYWFTSANDADMRANPVFDSSPVYFFTSGETGRSWRAGDPLHSLYGQAGPSHQVNTVVFIPSKIPGSSEWMYPANAGLTWVYARVSPVDIERDANGNVVWNPILPAEWRQTPPAPVLPAP